MVGKTDKLDKEIDLKELLAIIWSGKYFIAISTFAAIIYALFLTINTDKLYTARAVFEFRESGNSDFNISREFGAIAAIAGLSPGASSNSEMLIERIMGSEFILTASGNLSFASDPYFNTYNHEKSPKNWKTKLKKFIGLTEDPVTKQNSINQSLITNFRKNISAQETNAGALSLQVTHLNPILAANYANDLMQEIKNLVENDKEKSQDTRLNYLSETLADALQDMEESEEKLKEFALNNNTAARESFYSETLQLNELRMEKEDAIEIIKVLEALNSSLMNNRPLTLATYQKLRSNFPLVDDVNFRRILGMSETISAWEWPTSEAIQAVKSTLDDRMKRIDIEISEIEAEAQIYAKSAEKLAKLTRSAKIAEATYKVLIEQVKSQSLAAGFKPDSFKVFEAARPPLIPSKPNRNRNLLLGALLGLTFSSLIVLAYCTLRGVFYTKRALVIGSNCSNHLSVTRKLLRLAKQSFDKINDTLNKETLPILDETFALLSSNKVILLANSGSRINAKGLSLALSIRSFFSGNKVLLINFPGPSGKALSEDYFKDEKLNFEDFISVKATDFGVDILSFHKESFKSFNFFALKSFDQNMSKILKAYDQIFITIDRKEAKLALLKLTTYDPTLVILCSIKRTRKKDLNELIEIQPVEVLLNV